MAVADPGSVAPAFDGLGAVLCLVSLGILAGGAIVGFLEGHRGRPTVLGHASIALAGAGLLCLGLLTATGLAAVRLSAGDALGFVPFDVTYDRLAGVFLVILGGGAIASGVYGLGYAPLNGHDSGLTGAALPIFVLSMALVFGAANSFAFLLAWEVMALSSAALVFGARPSREGVSTGVLYIAVTHLATAALVVAFVVLAGAAGGSLSFAAARLAAAAGPAGAAPLSSLARDAVFVLIVIGFATKAGAIPFHVWLPRAHPAAPTPVSALMSGVMIKTGIYGLLRVGIDILGPGPDWWGVLVLGIGAISAVLGALYSLMEHDLKRLLAYSSVENTGIILLAIGAGLVLVGHGESGLAALAISAALFHVVNHAAFKSLLFLGAGSVQVRAGTGDLNHLGGIVRLMPVTALCFVVGAAAIAGVPPLNGFSSEWLTFQSLLVTGADAGLGNVVRSVALLAVGALALTAALGLAGFVRAFGLGFLALPRSEGAAEAREVTRPMRAGMAGLAAACVVLGLAAAPVAAALRVIAAPLAGVEGAPDPIGPTIALLPSPPSSGAVLTPLALALLLVAASATAGALLVRGRRRRGVRRVPTWACGIALEPSMEYTATGHAKPVRLFFRRVLGPEREVRVEYHPGTPFPRAISYRGSVTPYLESHLYRPLHRLAVDGAGLVRRLQNGSVRLYLAYALAALILLLAFAR